MTNSREGDKGVEALTVKRLSIYFEGTDLGYVQFLIFPVQHSSEPNAAVSDTTKASSQYYSPPYHSLLYLLLTNQLIKKIWDVDHVVLPKTVVSRAVVKATEAVARVAVTG